MMPSTIKPLAVGAIITNPNRSKFFIQVKDSEYSIKKWRGAYSFWGGAIELEDKNHLSALTREIKEELPQIAQKLINGKIKNIGDYSVKSDIDYGFRLYEITISNNELEKLYNHQPKEGNSKLITRKQLLSNNWISNLEVIINDYLSKNHKD